MTPLPTVRFRPAAHVRADLTELRRDLRTVRDLLLRRSLAQRKSELVAELASPLRQRVRLVHDPHENGDGSVCLSESVPFPPTRRENEDFAERGFSYRCGWVRESDGARFSEYSKREWGYE